MNANSTRFGGIVPRTALAWGATLVRLVVAALVAGPAVSKFLTYGTSVAFFRNIGLPAPELLVPLVGAVEVAAVGALVVDVRPRLAALALVPVMAVAIAYSGLHWKNVAVLSGALLILAANTDAAAVRTAADRVVG